MADEDGFQVVKKRKGHKNKICRENNGTSTTSSFYTSSEITICDVNELRTKIDKCRQDFSLLATGGFAFKLKLKFGDRALNRLNRCHTFLLLITAFYSE